MNVDIRKELPGDSEAISKVVAAAFETHPHSNQTEHLLVQKLRELDALTVSLVAVLDGEMVGHIAFSAVTVNGEFRHWYGLAPVSVLPEFQGRGIGTLLVEAGLARLRELGARGCVLLGEPGYYGRFGFRVREGLTLPGVPPEYFLALPLFEEEDVRGEVAYHEAFGICG